MSSFFPPASLVGRLLLASQWHRLVENLRLKSMDPVQTPSVDVIATMKVCFLHI